MTITAITPQFPTYSASLIIVNGIDDESEFVAKFSSNPISTMSSKSGATHCTTPTAMMMSEWTLGSITSSSSTSSASEAASASADNDSSLFRFSPSVTNSPTSSSSSSSRGRRSRPTNYFNELERSSTSIETPLNMKPYVTAAQHETTPQHLLKPYVVMSSSSSSSEQQLSLIHI